MRRGGADAREEARPAPGGRPLLPRIGWLVAALLFVFIWLRGTLPRFRYDQLMHFGWKVLIPVAAVWILVTATAVTFLPALGRDAEFMDWVADCAASLASMPATRSSTCSPSPC